ncbi:Uma2 family endonuclease [Streptomyces sp. NPDC001777]|uniref:Uma2 family endonuclease n=1 Tax=Streptomyces sp. NPDC001777 TaxID=3364608 RepID=UPI0036935395
MPAATTDRPRAGEPETLLTAANRIMECCPGYRVEIIGGVIVVGPLPDGRHARVLTRVMVPLLAAGLHGQATDVLQGIGLWLPGGPEDYAIPDLAIVDADLDEHLIENNCYDPAVFRLVLEVTSSNYNNDLRNKVVAYAEAKIPVYVIVDRRHGRVHVLTEPVSGGYDSHQVYAPGQTVTLPESIGAPVTLDVDGLIRAGRPRG